MSDQLTVFAEAIRAQLLAFAPDGVAAQIKALPSLAIVGITAFVALVAVWVLFAAVGGLFGGKRRREAEDESAFEPVFSNERRRDPPSSPEQRRFDDRREGALRQEPARQDFTPQSAAPQRDLYAFQDDITARIDRLIQNNDLPGALASAREALDVARQAAFQQPESIGPQRLVAKALHRVGDLSGKLGDSHGARQNHEQALVLLRRLFAGNPRDAGIARELAVTLERVGTAATQSNDRATARASFEEELRIAAQMATLEPSDLGWVRFKAVVHIMLGNLNEQDHRAHYEQARQLFETLERSNAIEARDADTLQQLRGVLQA